MTTQERDLYRRKIEELTDMLRGDPDWEDLRGMLRERRVEVSKALLAAFMEDEEGVEYGILITGDGRVVESQRRVSPPDDAEVSVWRDRTNDTDIVREYPQVSVALEIALG